MTKTLFEVLGLDESDPRAVAALEDSGALMDLVEALVNRRHQLGLVQQDVADEMETTQSAVSDFERLGGDPKLSTLQRYARAVGARIRVAIEQRDADGGWNEVAVGNIAGIWNSPVSKPTPVPHIVKATNDQFALSA